MLFFPEKKQKSPSRWALFLRLHAPIVAILFFHAQFSQRTTFEIIITAFLNKQYRHEIQLYCATMFDHNSERFR